MIRNARVGDRVLFRSGATKEVGTVIEVGRWDRGPGTRIVVKPLDPDKLNLQFHPSELERVDAGNSLDALLEAARALDERWDTWMEAEEDEGFDEVLVAVRQLRTALAMWEGVQR